MTEVTKHQSEQRVFWRSEIHPAPYNPRTISDTALANIRRNIKKIGLLGGVVVNLATMNIVSGHQRVTVLDQLHKYNPDTHENDYQFRCETIDVDEKTEKEQNIFMNSHNAQGEFDWDKMQLIIEDIDIKAAALDDSDLRLIDIKLPEADKGDNDQILTDIVAFQKPYEERKAAIKEAKAAQREKAAERSQTSYFVVRFDSVENKEYFLERFGYDPSDEYVQGELFSDKIERVQ